MSRLNPHEVDKLAHTTAAGVLAQRRLARGTKLNHPESVSLIAYVLLELARDGKHTVAQLMDVGRSLLGKRQVMTHVPSLVDMVQVEATFPDGTKLVSVHSPISNDDGNLQLALHGSFLPVPEVALFGDVVEESGPSPGALAFDDTSEGIVINEGRDAVRITVTNCGDRPVQVGSHFNFAEANSWLEFDRMQAIGRRLHIASGTAVRFEPGESKQVVLCGIGGLRVVRGGNNLGMDPQAAMAAMQEQGFRHKDEPAAATGTTADEAFLKTVTRAQYAAMYGPTTGDRVRLADTDLWVRVERDLTVYGDECKFGGGKTIRDGMGQRTGATATEVLDLVLTNALIIDHTGIYKADIGIRAGRIAAIGKAGNPDTMDGVTPGMVVGVNTEVIGAEGKIVTAGALDVHVHYICPQLLTEAIASGITTLLGGGTGPATGSNATTCTPHPSQMKMMLQATDSFPMNIAFTGKGNSSAPEGLVDIINAGACGLKLHEDWGTTPAAIDACLSVADEHDIAVTIHTDTLNESCCVEKSIESFKGRAIHTYHSEGAGGGHAPDILRVCGEENVLPSSTNPTRPFTKNTVEEHLDMLMVCHHLSPNLPEDLAFAESRIRHETIAAEDILHDVGAISMIASDSQAMGRIGEVVCRTWQTAHKNKLQRGYLPEDEGTNADNFRVRRYIAKYTINPSIAHGFSEQVGSVEVGKLADLCLWSPAFFGLKPEMVIKGGAIAFAQMGDANASIPTPEPVLMRPQFGANAPPSRDIAVSLAFVSRACIESGTAASYNLKKVPVAVRSCRGVGKKDMVLNSYVPKLTVDPETYVVTMDGVRLTCEPLEVAPLAQLYSLF